VERIGLRGEARSQHYGMCDFIQIVARIIISWLHLFREKVGLFHADKRAEHSTKPFFLQIKVTTVSHTTPPPKLIMMLLV